MVADFHRGIARMLPACCSVTVTVLGNPSTLVVGSQAGRHPAAVPSSYTADRSCDAALYHDPYSLQTSSKLQTVDLAPGHLQGYGYGYELLFYRDCIRAFQQVCCPVTGALDSRAAAVSERGWIRVTRFRFNSIPKTWTTLRLSLFEDCHRAKYQPLKNSGRGRPSSMSNKSPSKGSNSPLRSQPRSPRARSTAPHCF